MSKFSIRLKYSDTISCSKYNNLLQNKFYSPNIAESGDLFQRSVQHCHDIKASHIKTHDGHCLSFSINGICPTCDHTVF